MWYYLDAEWSRVEDGVTGWGINVLAHTWSTRTTYATIPTTSNTLIVVTYQVIGKTNDSTTTWDYKKRVKFFNNAWTVINEGNTVNNLNEDGASTTPNIREQMSWTDILLQVRWAAWVDSTSSCERSYKVV